MTVVDHDGPSVRRLWVRWAWFAVALTPVGFGLALLAFVWLVIRLRYDFDAPGGPNAGFGQVLVIEAAAGLIALAVPSAAVVLSVVAFRAGEPGASSVRTVAWVILVVAAGVTRWVGLVLWGPVLYLALRRTSGAVPARGPAVSDPVPPVP